MSNYTVKVGESVSDVILNSTGSLLNWDAIATANGWTDWTPLLTAGDQIIIPATVNIDPNSLRDAQQYPKCNAIRQGILDQISDLWSIILNNWILTTGFWNDQAVWIDTDVWID